MHTYVVRDYRMKRALAENVIIHLIDDEPDIVNIATAALQQHGYTVHSFSDASKAIKDMELKCKSKVGMVITDIRMPGYSGFDIARRIKAINSDVPIVLMTAFEINSIEFEKIFPSLEVNDFLQKPFRINQLLEIVRRYLR